jgi:hypothetical protein
MCPLHARSISFYLLPPPPPKKVNNSFFLNKNKNDTKQGTVLWVRCGGCGNSTWQWKYYVLFLHNGRNNVISQ